MKIVDTYSFKGGEKFLKTHHTNELQEVLDSINDLDASICLTKESREKTKKGQVLFSPVDMNKYIEQYSLWHSTDVQVWQAFTKMGNMRLLLEVGNEPFNQSLNSLNREDSVRTMETAIIYRDILKYRRTLEKDQGETELNLQLQLVDHLRTKVKFSGDSSSLS